MSVYVCIASFPYIFVNFGSVNISLFDVLLSTLVPITLWSGIKIISKKFYILSTCVIVLSTLPLLSYAEDIEYVWGTLQMAYILLVMYPLITSIINEKRYGISLRVACIVWGLFLIFNTEKINDPRYYEAAGRFTGLYNTPLTMGLTTAIMFPILLSFTISTKSAMLKLLFCLSMSLSIVCMYASGSRAAITGLAIGLIFYFLAKGKYDEMFVVICFSIIGLICASYYVSPGTGRVRNLYNRFYSEPIIKDLYRILPSSAVGVETLLFGTGIGNSSFYTGDVRPHNFFIAMAVEVGITGMLFMVWIVYISVGRGLIYALFKNYCFDRNNDLKIAVLSSGVVFLTALLVSSVPLHRGYWFILSICLWIKNTNKHICNK